MTWLNGKIIEHKDIERELYATGQLAFDALVRTLDRHSAEGHTVQAHHNGREGWSEVTDNEKAIAKYWVADEKDSPEPQKP